MKPHHRSQQKSEPNQATDTSAARGVKARAFKAAFPYTIPIFTGFVFLGIAYGIYMNISGFPPIYPIVMSALIFGGSMEFIAVSLLLSRFNPLGTLLLTLMVHTRHIFYGISMLDKYKDTGKKKAYLIFGMCDESFSINYTADVPKNIDKGWFYFFVTMLNHCYWVLGATLGGVFGELIGFDIEGLEFVMTALLVVIFLDNWIKEKNHISSLSGIALTLICLIIFGSDNFLLPSMICILLFLTIIRRKLEPKLESKDQGENVSEANTDDINETDKTEKGDTAS
ncbi:MAG: AzlC family ABC transporter permease [Bacillota bacterium]|nr:AzlC family ABC transporter permease [Bacillota bacterium]